MQWMFWRPLPRFWFGNTRILASRCDIPTLKLGSTKGIQSKMVKVAVLGSGGREHALGWKLAQSPHVSEVLFIPGNGGTHGSKYRKISIDLTTSDAVDRLADCLQKEDVALTIIGPEAPLASGWVEQLQNQGIPSIWGPTSHAAILESDKFESHRRMEALQIPHAQGQCCTSKDEVYAAIESYIGPQGIVLKARGLTGGKGVRVCSNAHEAYEAHTQLTQRYGSDILVAERLEGPEFSVFTFCNGTNCVPFPVAFQDYKPRYNGNTGPNTGGMGAYGPVPFVTSDLLQNIVQTCIRPVLHQLQDEGTPFCGFLYAGMMYTPEGPKVLEYNVRFGDPECQPAMLLMENDLYTTLQALLAHKTPDIQIHPGAACCVVLASQGYPGTIQSGYKIEGLQQLPSNPDLHVFHAGTRLHESNVYTQGGRVLGLTAYAVSGIQEAQKRCYALISSLSIPNGFQYRTDIAELI